MCEKNLVTLQHRVNILHFMRDSLFSILITASNVSSLAKNVMLFSVINIKINTVITTELCTGLTVILIFFVIQQFPSENCTLVCVNKNLRRRCHNPEASLFSI